MSAQSLSRASLALVLLLVPVRAEAHAFRPALLEVTGLDYGDYEVLWKVPARLVDGVPSLAPGSDDLRPVFPESCRASGPPASTVLPDGVASRWGLDCGPGGLAGSLLRIDGLAPSQLDVLVRVGLSGGETYTAVLRGAEDTVEVPGAGAGRDSPGGALIGTIRAYVELGVFHILGGIDHLLFVLGLLLLVRSRRALVATITAFTLAHSLTLAMAVLGLVQVPSQPVEAVIALSILLLAVELTRDPASVSTVTRRQPWLVALVFGLLHGFGFAGGLREVGLPADQIPLVLLSFNIGVELGQLAFVLAVLALLGILRRWWSLRPALGVRAAAYVIGGLSATWMAERVAGFWKGVF